jgi:hypothetical protein
MERLALSEQPFDVMQLIFLPLFLLAWWRIEFREGHVSNGVASLILGCCIFGFGAVNLSEYDKIFSGAIVAAGLLVALIGLGRFIVYELANAIPR